VEYIDCRRYQHSAIIRYSLDVLTFFTTAKPFVGHNGLIQRNALKSWMLLDREVEIILFGDDAGAAEVAQELGIRHEPVVERNEFGTIRIDYMFARAQELAKHDVVCYSNCDIIFLPDFCSAIQRIKSVQPKFLATGRRWNMDIGGPIDFSSPDWQRGLKTQAFRANGQQSRWFIDYFAFSRGFFRNDIPPLAVGRIYWDNWLLWKACESEEPVVDISQVVVAVHQNHDYRHHPQGRQGVYGGEEAERNLQLAGGWDHLRTISDAQLVLGRKGLRQNRRRYWHVLKRTARPGARYVRYRLWHPLWFAVLGLTRPLRTVLGLRTESARRARDKL
jgi:hypothetical protein